MKSLNLPRKTVGNNSLGPRDPGPKRPNPPTSLSLPRQLPAKRRVDHAKPRKRVTPSAAKGQVLEALTNFYGASWAEQLAKVLDAGREICYVYIVLT